MSRGPTRSSGKPKRAAKAAGVTEDHRAGDDSAWQQLQLTVQELYQRLALIEAALNALPAWISVKDLKGRYRLVNDAMLAGHGATRKAFLGHVTSESVELSTGGLSRVANLDEVVLRTGEPAELPRYVVRLPDGRERIRALTKVPLRDEDGDLIGIVGWSEDISERVLADDALDAQRRLLQAVIDVVPHPVNYADSDARLMVVNPAWCRFHRVEQDAAIGQFWTDLDTLTPELRDQIAGEIRSIASGEISGYENTYKTLPGLDGTPRDMMVSRTTVRGSTGNVNGVVSIGVDITRQRQAERDARVAEQRLKDAIESLPAAFYLYDSDARLITFNSTAAEYYPTEAEVLRPGTHYRDIVAHGLRVIQSEEPTAQGRVDRAMRLFVDPPESFEQHLLDGRVMLGRNRRTSEGGTVSIRYDITELKRTQEALEASNRQIQADLQIAADVQARILRPLEPPPYLAAELHFRPSSRVSGDLYHGHADPDGAYHFFIGDATGHGVAAGFMSLLVEAGLSSLDPRLSPSTLLTELNVRLSAYELDGRFVSGIGMRIDRAGLLTMACAGHPTMILLPTEGQAPVLEDLSGLPLGWFDTAEYEAVSRRLRPGDKLLLYTDGLTEWGRTDEEQFGLERLARVAWDARREPNNRMLATLLDAAQGHAGGTAPTDDVTVAIFEYRGESEAGPAPAPAG